MPPTLDSGSIIAPPTPDTGSIVIPPTTDNSSIIMPPTMVNNPNDNKLPTQNSMMIIPPPTRGTPIPTSTTDAIYDPAYWGLPAQVGSYEIMVVVPSENQACAPPNQLQLLLHALPDQPQTLTRGDIEQLETRVHRTFGLMFLSSVTTIKQVRSQTEDWNAAMGGGCISFGGPIPTLTSNPDDPISMTSYDPAYYGLPDRIAGYKLLAIKNVENSKCAANAVVQVVLQMSPSEVGKLTKATYDKIMSELDKLGWKIDQWLIGYIEPGTSKQDIVAICAPNVDRAKLR